MRSIVLLVAFVAVLCAAGAVSGAESPVSLSNAEAQLRDQYGVISAELRALSADSAEAVAKNAELLRIAASLVTLTGAPSAESVDPAAPVFPLVKLARQIVAAAEAEAAADKTVAADDAADLAVSALTIDSSTCPNRAGTCKSTSSGCSGGSFASGLCPGASDIKCCIPNSVCQSRGGTCLNTALGCSGTFSSGLCPGASNIKCCISGGSGGSCGPYASAAVTNMVGNGNRNYGVVKVVREHLTNPAIYSQSATAADNTMLKSTACAFSAMHDAAKRSGVTITINSAFRCLARQEYFWNCYITKKCNNGNLAARPGTSNHGVGLALDLNSSGSGVYNWLRNNAHSYGFIRTVSSETWHWEHRPGSPPAPYT